MTDRAGAGVIDSDRRPTCAECGERIDGVIVPCRITDDDLIVFYHEEHEPDD